MIEPVASFSGRVVLVNGPLKYVVIEGVLGRLPPVEQSLNVYRDSQKVGVVTVSNQSRGASFAAFYFAGHGTQWNNQAYLVPVDADLSVPKTEVLVPVRQANAACNGAQANMRIYDNCRNNPADGWRQQEAAAALVRHETEPRSWAMHSLKAECEAADDVLPRAMDYAAGFLRRKRAVAIEDASDRDLWSAVYTVRRKAAQLRKASAEACR